MWDEMFYTWIGRITCDELLEKSVLFLLKPNFYLFIQYFVSFLCMFGLFVSDYQKYNPNVSSTWNVRPLSELSHMWSKWYMGMYLINKDNVWLSKYS